MYVSTQRLSRRFSAGLRPVFWLSLGLAFAISPRIGEAEELPPPITQPMPPRVAQGSPYGGPTSDLGDVIEDGTLLGEQFSGRSGEAYGVLGRAGVLTGPAVGRTGPIVPIEIMPYAFADNFMIFGSFRGFRAQTDGWGMNLGGGARYYSQRWDRIFGGNAYYDYDNSSGSLFRQTGFGLESLGAQWDARANIYTPFGSTDALLSTDLVSGSQHFVDHRMLYNNLLTFGNALRGIDLELGMPVPGRVMRRHDVRVFGGWYTYQGKDVASFNGWKGRIQANVIDSINLQLEVFNDQIFNTSVVFGATWTYGGFSQPADQPRTQFNRMTEMVRRNYNVVVAEIPVLDIDKVATNPLTSAPYFFEHVASYAPVPGADGTVEHPWQTVNQAQTAMTTLLPTVAERAGNIIYVHAGSVYDTAPDNTVTLLDSVRILGEGNISANRPVQHVIRVPELGNILLPTIQGTPNRNRPLFENQAGIGGPVNTVTLVSGTLAPSEFSGFQIGDPSVASSGPTGIGIIGDGVANVVVNQTNVNFALGDGVFLNNLTGNVTMLGTVINNVGNANTGVDGLHIVGVTGSANVFQVLFGTDTLSGATGVINNTGGYALETQSIQRGSSVLFAGAAINDGTVAVGATPGLTGQGILLNNTDGLVNIDNISVYNSIGTGIDIQGGLGQTTFSGLITIDEPTGDAIRIQGLQSQPAVGAVPAIVSRVSFLQPPPPGPGVAAPGIRITNRHARGFNISNNQGNVRLFEPVTITAGNPIIPLLAAIDFEGNTGNASFGNITIAPQVGANAGNGNGIQIGTTASNTGTFQVTGTTTINGIGQNSIEVQNNDGFVTFSTVNIGSRGQRGILFANNTQGATFSGATQVDNGNNSLLPAVDINNNLIINNDPTVGAIHQGSVSFTTLAITNAQGPANRGAGLNVVDNLPGVSVGTLNITLPSATVGGIALYVNNAGAINGVSPNTLPAPITINSATPLPTIGVTVGTGTIDAFGREAINVQDSVIGLNFLSVSSTNSVADGIFLSNNVGAASQVKTDGTTIHPVIFQIRGTPNVPGSGGTIQGANGNGATFQDTEGVQIANAIFNGNGGAGVFASTPELDLFGITATGNGLTGVTFIGAATPPVANSVGPRTQITNPVFTMFGSTVNTNTGNEVLFTASTRGTYNVTLGSFANPNLITDADADAVLINNAPAAINSVLNLQVVGNTITSTVAGAAGLANTDLNINWNGSLFGAANLNTFNFGVSFDTGILLNLPSTTAGSNFQIMSNTFNAPAGFNTTGIDVTTGGAPTTLTIGQLLGAATGNVMNFNSPGIGTFDTGMRFNLGANSNVNIFNNSITMVFADEATGIEFTNVQGTSNITINNNFIQIDDGPDVFTDEYGISILATSGRVNLFGTQDNIIQMYNPVITGSGIPFDNIPPGVTVNGTFLVNGVPVP